MITKNTIKFVSDIFGINPTEIIDIVTEPPPVPTLKDIVQRARNRKRLKREDVEYWYNRSSKGTS